MSFEKYNLSTRAGGHVQESDWVPAPFAGRRDMAGRHSGLALLPANIPLQAKVDYWMSLTGKGNQAHTGTRIRAVCTTTEQQFIVARTRNCRRWNNRTSQINRCSLQGYQLFDAGVVWPLGLSAMHGPCHMIS